MTDKNELLKVIESVVNDFMDELVTRKESPWDEKVYVDHSKMKGADPLADAYAEQYGEDRQPTGPVMMNAEPTIRPDDTPRFEYYILHWGNYAYNTSVVQEELNAMARKGWSIRAVENDKVYLERPLV